MSGWWFVAPFALLEAWWVARARGTVRTKSAEPLWSRVSYLAVLVVAILLLAGWPRVATLDRVRLWPSTAVTFAVGLAMSWLGVGFAIWAREHLGRYWSGRVTLKEGHQLIRTGPYRVVRHPIYTGALVALTGVAVARGDLRGVVGVALSIVVFLRKIFLEERVLIGHFGDAYRDYRRQVRALIPFIL